MAKTPRLHNDNPLQTVEGARTELHGIELRRTDLATEIDDLAAARAKLQDDIAIATKKLDLIKAGSQPVIDDAERIRSSANAHAAELAKEHDARDHALRIRESAVLARELTVDQKIKAAEESKAIYEDLRSQTESRVEGLNISVAAHADKVATIDANNNRLLTDLDAREAAVRAREEAATTKEAELSEREITLHSGEAAVDARSLEVTKRTDAATQREATYAKRLTAVQDGEKIVAGRTLDLNTRAAAIAKAEEDARKREEGLTIRSKELDLKEIDLRTERKRLDLGIGA